MPDEAATPEVRKSGLSLIWLLPLLTLLVGAWLAVKTITEQGPVITITFVNAEGVEAGKTKIKYKDIDLGVVTAVRFSHDSSHVELTARMDKEAAQFLRRNTQFWVVKPKLTLRGVSGLGTLVSGSYIEMSPGQGDAWRRFEGLEDAPVVQTDTRGREIILMSHHLGSIEVGSPLYYQGILAGEVLGYTLSNDKQSVFVNAFVKAPYDQLVNSSSRFWNASGIDVAMSTDGIHVKAESLLSMMLGGIAFETPDPQLDDGAAADGLIYTLYDSHRQIEDELYTKKMRLIAFFQGSVRGLEAGAPVELNGIKIGEVKAVNLEFDVDRAAFRVPVVLEIEPERVTIKSSDRQRTQYEMLQMLIQHGLRARLQSGSMLTGKLYVEMGMFPRSPIHLMGDSGAYPELPTIPSDMASISESVKHILAKLDKVQIGAIGDDLDASLKQMHHTLAQFSAILAKIDPHTEPIAQQLQQSLTVGHQALAEFQQTLQQLQPLLDRDSPLQYRFVEMNRELSAMARAVRALVEMLEQDPNALLVGKRKRQGGG